MYAELSFNTAVARTGITVSGRRPLEWNQGGGYYKGESIAAAGEAFQHHRVGIAPTYVVNAVPTEVGYASVGYTPHSATHLIGATLRLHHAKGCPQECDLVTYGEDKIRDIVSASDHEIALLKNGTLWRVGAQGLEYPLTVSGVNTAEALGAFTIGGRLCLYTHHDIHISSEENHLDFTPSLRTQAQSFSIRYNIGDIVSVTGFGDAAYIWGSRGAVYMHCTGDVGIPYGVKVVTDFTGIYHKRNVQVDYAASTFHVWSRSGLVQVQGTQSSVTRYADVSEALSEQRIVWFPAWETQPCSAEVRSPTDHLQTVCYADHIEGYTSASKHPCLPPPRAEPMYREQVIPCGLISVREHNTRWVTISYATCESTAEHPVFYRLLVMDKALSRTTVIHKAHTDVAATRCTCNEGAYGALALTSSDGIQLIVHKEGEAMLYFNQISGSTGRIVKLVGCVLQGEFKADTYPDVEWTASHIQNASAYGSKAQRYSESPDAPILSRILCTSGQDIHERNHLHNMRLLTKTRGHLFYAGVATGHTVSVLAPFRGNLTEFILRNVI